MSDTTSNTTSNTDKSARVGFSKELLNFSSICILLNFALLISSIITFTVYVVEYEQSCTKYCDDISHHECEISFNTTTDRCFASIIENNKTLVDGRVNSCYYNCSMIDTAFVGDDIPCFYDDGKDKCPSDKCRCGTQITGLITMIVFQYVYLFIIIIFAVIICVLRRIIYNDKQKSEYPKMQHIYDSRKNVVVDIPAACGDACRYAGSNNACSGKSRNIYIHRNDVDSDSSSGIDGNTLTNMGRAAYV